MLRLHRFLLLCLLVVAIPMQGFAVATMTQCVGPAASSTAIDMDGMDMTGMETAADAESDACADVRSPAHKGSCSASTACCAVAAPGATFVPSFADMPAVAVDVPIRRQRVAFVTGGPERPPRVDFA